MSGTAGAAKCLSRGSVSSRPRLGELAKKARIARRKPRTSGGVSLTLTSSDDPEISGKQLEGTSPSSRLRHGLGGEVSGQGAKATTPRATPPEAHHPQVRHGRPGHQTRGPQIRTLLTEPQTHNPAIRKRIQEGHHLRARPLLPGIFFLGITATVTFPPRAPKR